MDVVTEDQAARYAREPVRPAPPSMDHLEATANRDVFPHDLLAGCESALCLFSAAFHGRQDALWIARAGLTATCVDLDDRKLQEMRALYPATWTFVCADVFDHVLGVPVGSVDVVTVDCWSNQFQECADMAAVWCRAARRLVLIASGLDTRTVAPDGWELLPAIRRSGHLGGVFWTVLVAK